MCRVMVYRTMAYSVMVCVQKSLASWYQAVPLSGHYTEAEHSIVLIGGVSVFSGLLVERITSHRFCQKCSVLFIKTNFSSGIDHGVTVLQALQWNYSPQTGLSFSRERGRGTRRYTRLLPSGLYSKLLKTIPSFTSSIFFSLQLNFVMPVYRLLLLWFFNAFIMPWLPSWSCLQRVFSTESIRVVFEPYAVPNELHYGTSMVNDAVLKGKVN